MTWVLVNWRTLLAIAVVSSVSFVLMFKLSTNLRGV